MTQSRYFQMERRRVDGVAVGIGIASQVEPVPAPAFAVMRAGQQAIDDVLVPVRRCVPQGGIDLRGRRRQTEQIEAQPAKQGNAVGFPSGDDLLLFQSGEDESVNGIAHPGLITDRRLGNPDRRLECPVIPRIGGQFVSRCPPPRRSMP